MSISEIASLIAAIAFAVLVVAMVVPLLKLGKFFADLSTSVQEITASSIQTVDGTSEAMTQVNVQLERVDTITQAASRSAEDLSALTTLLSATLGKPLIKISAFSYAVRKAMNLGAKK
ncbi:MAG: DUF948 domain-containing protein [Actinomycetaceae bacterium]|nr:DUF948 domain-containing protein [Actinomycetaceae bacterium]